MSLMFFKTQKEVNKEKRHKQNKEEAPKKEALMSPSVAALLKVVRSGRPKRAGRKTVELFGQKAQFSGVHTPQWCP